MRMRQQGRYGHRPGRLDVIRLVVASLLVVWGVSLALSGLGLSHSAFGDVFNVYWPVPFALFGLAGLFFGRTWGRAPGFYGLLLAGGAVLTLVNVRVPGLHMGSLVWAAVVIGVAVVMLIGVRWWWWL